MGSSELHQRNLAGPVIAAVVAALSPGCNLDRGARLKRACEQTVVGQWFAKAKARLDATGAAHYVGPPTSAGVTATRMGVVVIWRCWLLTLAAACAAPHVTTHPSRTEAAGGPGSPTRARAAAPAAVPSPADTSPAPTDPLCSPAQRTGDPVAICNLRVPGTFAIKNVSDAPVELRAAAVVESEVQPGLFRDATVNFELFEECMAAGHTPRCVRLEPGAEIRPVPWLGLSCSGQCPRMICLRNTSINGRARLVVLSCDGATRFVAAAFDMRTVHGVASQPEGH